MAVFGKPGYRSCGMSGTTGHRSPWDDDSAWVSMLRAEPHSALSGPRPVGAIAGPLSAIAGTTGLNWIPRRALACLPRGVLASSAHDASARQMGRYTAQVRGIRSCEEKP